MTDLQTEVAPKPRAKPVKKAKAKRALAAKPFVAPDEFAGMTATECCDACFEKGECIISGSICVHPNKGGLQAALMRNPSVLAKFQRAKKALEHQIVDLRGTVR